MKKYLLFILIINVVLLGSCSSKKAFTESNNPAVINTEETQWKPHGPLFFIAPEGKYKGAIPCKDCPGIEVSLDFKDDNSVVKTMRYIQSTNKNAKDVGTWVVTSNNIIQVSYSQKTAPQEYYKAQSGGHLIMLNDKKELNINPSQAQFFIFNPDK
ncbi:copper resistance protein NlpE N-terminal domain-containing protein [Albibacterium bauzanense]|uniref:NlpE-like protein n=1 Tax=Albibacterium bauzanense TaxID=653929 RepID=A0A4R1LUI9_9SPHI|nr:copper resistance protein NlpE N-terminal domain-containing protein [Albibacterium bauzanense]TCK83028.1 NlpE-like protein [Albibacterium bauzanense]